MSQEEDFRGRYATGGAWEEEVRARFDRLGFATSRYGQAMMLPPEMQKRADHVNNCPVAKFIRYLPDLLVSRADKFYLVEAKSLERTDTDSYSFELSSYEADMKLAAIGVPVIAVFEGWRADYVSNLKVKKRLDMPGYLAGVDGSKTAFVLIEKESVQEFEAFVAGLGINLAELM